MYVQLCRRAVSLEGLVLLAIVASALHPTVSLGQKEERRLLSPAHVAEDSDDLQQWEADEWMSGVSYSTVRSSRSDQVSLRMQADSLSQGRFHRQVSLAPNSEYRLTYWIKTNAVNGEQNGGAGIRLGGLEFSPDTTIRGSSEWTRREVTFRTQDDDSMVLEVLLGKEGPAHGEVLVGDISLRQVSSTPLEPSVTVHMDRTRPPMSKYIYGQFIEHMGRSIYGGLWAEMLEDRKFNFVPGTQRSPWRVRSRDRLDIDSVDAFVGDYSPIVRATDTSATEFYQENLVLEEGRAYEGYAVLSTSSPSTAVDVILAAGSSAEKRDSVRIQVGARKSTKYAFSFESPADTDNGRLSVVPRGEAGDLEIGTMSLMPADHVEGFRPDVLELMKELNAPVYRWPGGNFVSGYNWKDGVGPRDERPPRVDEAWKSDYEHVWQAVEPNDVGIHEFMRLCDILDAEPFVAVNTGLGTATLAAQEVEYLNGSANTPMGQWRAENGHSEPFDVRFFAVGNEMYGDWQLGSMPVEHYVRKHNRVAQAMWDVDPTIELVAVGNSGEWNEQMYRSSSDYMTYISEHFYRQDWHGGGLMTHVKQIPEAIADIADEHRRWHRELDVLQEKDVKVALDEWNYWYGPHVYGLLGTRYFLRDALGIAAGVNEYLRNTDIIFMANYAQTVNVIGAIKATPTDSFLSATGVVLKTYRQKMGTIPVEVTGETLPFDVAAALTPEEEYLTISVVNPTKRDQRLPLAVDGGTLRKRGEAHVISGTDDMTYNDVNNKNNVNSKVREVEIMDGGISVPEISASIYKFKIR